MCGGALLVHVSRCVAVSDDVLPVSCPDVSSPGNVDKLIESLAAQEATPTEEAPLIGQQQGAEPEPQEEEEQKRGGGEEDMERGGGGEEAPPTLQQPSEGGMENLGAGCEELPVCEVLPVCEEAGASVRRRHPRPE